MVKEYIRCQQETSLDQTGPTKEGQGRFQVQQQQLIYRGSMLYVCHVATPRGRQAAVEKWGQVQAPEHQVNTVEQQQVSEGVSCKRANHVAPSKQANNTRWVRGCSHGRHCTSCCCGSQTVMLDQHTYHACISSNISYP